MTFTSFKEKFTGDGLRARAIRGTAMTFFGFGGAQFLRLLSNLVLTRLLFPEAFGLMALVQVFMVGLQMFSDTGINTSILQSKRGDDPAFLNTAWTVDLIRGVFLWLIIVGCAPGVASFYEQPMLAQLLPVAGLAVIIQAARSTKMVVANRHLLLGRVTLVDLSSQVVGIVVMIVLAWMYESIWSLVIGGLISAILRSALSHIWFPGDNNHLQLEGPAFWELFHFGKFIFVASIAGFMVNYADRAILGKFISIADLGIYNIAYFLATVPFVLARLLGNRVMIPIYRETPPSDSADNFAKARKARAAMFAVLFGITLITALLGKVIIGVLYDPQYLPAGPILVLLPLAYLPSIVTIVYASLLLSVGDSRIFTVQTIVLAVLQTSLLIWGVSNFGILGAVLAPGIAAVLAYPITAIFARKYGGLDFMLDMAFFGLTALAVGLVTAIHSDAYLLILGG